MSLSIFCREINSENTENKVIEIVTVDFSDLGLKAGKDP